MIARFAFRIVACVCWWAAAVLATVAYDEHSGVVDALAWMLVILLISAGAAFWKGSEA